MNPRMFCRLLTAAVFVLALPVSAEMRPSDPKAFEAQVQKGVAQINEWKRISQQKDGQWQKRRLEVSQLKYDVIRTESALRPLIGTVRMYVHSIGHLSRPDSESAASELAIADGTPLGVGGKDWVTTEYELQFEPSERGWVFFQGKALNSMSIKISEAVGQKATWYELTPPDSTTETLHAIVLRAFEPPQAAPAPKPAPVTPRHKAKTNT